MRYSLARLPVPRPARWWRLARGPVRGARRLALAVESGLNQSVAFSFRVTSLHTIIAPRRVQRDPPPPTLSTRSPIYLR